MKAKTLFYCPRDENELLFEEIYDEHQEFDYQPLHELPQVCPKCGRVLFKKDCITVEELYKNETLPNFA
jgi:transcription initiation factor IIE alpha subunit